MARQACQSLLQGIWIAGWRDSHEERGERVRERDGLLSEIIEPVPLGPGESDFGRGEDQTNRHGRGEYRQPRRETHSATFASAIVWRQRGRRCTIACGSTA